MKPLIGLLALLLVACGADPIDHPGGQRGTLDVVIIGEVDGCKIYRFWDRGASRYFVRCPGGQQGTFWQESCGKGCTRPVTIATEIVGLEITR